MTIASELGATEEISVERFAIYITDTGPDGKLADYEGWVDTAMAVMFLISDGVTRIDTTGRWGAASADNENTALVYTFIESGAKFEAGLPQVASFAHTYGRRTGQDTVFLEWSGEYKDAPKDPTRFASRSFRVNQYPKAVDDGVPLADLFGHLASGFDLSTLRSDRPN